MIPRRFFWLLDAILLSIAFPLAYRGSPAAQGFVTPGGVLFRISTIQRLLPPPASSAFPPISHYLWILLAMVPTTIILLELFGIYNRKHQLALRAPVVALVAPFLSMSIVALVLFATKEGSISRILMFLYAVISGGALCLARIGLRRWWRLRLASGFYTRNVVLVGEPAGIATLQEHFRGPSAGAEFRLMGYLTVDEGAVSSVGTLPCLGPVRSLGDLAVHQPIHEVVIMLGSEGTPWLDDVIKQCDYFRLTVRVVPASLIDVPLTDLSAPPSEDLVHLPAVVLRPPEIDSDELFLKRLLDVVVSAIALILLSPLFVLIAAAIKITTPDLPVFYPWIVIGRNGVKFRGFKFTTMVADADAKKKDLMAQNEMSGPVFKIKDDPRVTPLGKILRKFSLNELPQLWSVLKGDMSLVGPRPAGPHELERYEFWHKRKLSIQSGITCLWQVRGRNAISDFDDWVRMDLEYIENWSLKLDLKILFRTVWVVIRGSGS